MGKCLFFSLYLQLFSVGGGSWGGGGCPYIYTHISGVGMITFESRECSFSRGCIGSRDDVCDEANTGFGISE